VPMDDEMNAETGTAPESRSALRRKRERELRLRMVLNAAETLFARQGYHQTGMEEIADMAEVSTGSVYFYFKNKEDLLINLMKEIGYQLRELLGTELNKTDLSLDSLRNIAVAFLEDFCARHPEKIAIFFRESVGQSREVEEVRKEVFLRLVSDIKEALLRIADRLDRRFVSDAAPEVIAVCIVGIYDRLACHYLLWRDHPKNIMDAADEVIGFMLGGVEKLLGNTEQ